MTLKQTFLLTTISAIFLTACTDKKNFEEAVLAKMKADPDLKDYKIDPERMRDCVVDTVGQDMPGIFFGDPDRLKAYQAYTKMISLMKSSDPQKTLTELRNDFGSAKAFSEANRNFSESVLLCQTALTSETDLAAKDASEKPSVSAVNAAPTVAPEVVTLAPAAPEAPATPPNPASVTQPEAVPATK